MTQMSEPRSPDPAFSRGNSARRRGGSRLARALHAVGVAVPVLLSLLVAGVAGCVLPPSLAVDNSDAGVNSPPTIVAVRSDQQEFPEFSTLTFEVNTNSTLNLTLLDSDINDTLTAKVFVDYDLPTPPNPTAPRSTCTPAAGGVAAQRSSTCDLHGLCTATDLTTFPAGFGNKHVMSVVVFDRPVLDSGTPTYQAMPLGGLSTSRTYFLICQQAAP